MKKRVSCSFSSDLEPKTLSLPMRRNAAWCGRKEGREPHAGHEASNTAKDGLNVVLYPMASDILKIGRYIAITINPITIPRNTIMMGSSNDVSEATAWSTSSS